MAISDKFQIDVSACTYFSEYVVLKFVLISVLIAYNLMPKKPDLNLDTIGKLKEIAIV